jgi:predicted acylesterase/phospholipase RssA
MNPLPTSAPENRKKLALVLAGGGIPGWMYEIGCLAAMDDFFENFSVQQFDIFVGTSAGSTAAAFMANGIPPRVIYEDIKNNGGRFDFARRDIYSFGYRETFRLFKKLVRSLLPIARHFMDKKHPFSILDLLLMLEENLPSGIFTLQNMQTTLSRFFSADGLSDDFRKLKKELYIPAVDLDTARYDVFGEGALADIPISQAVTASSAIPILFQPVHIRGKDYIDGGVSRVAHVDIAMNHGAELLWVVNPVQYIINDRSKVCLFSFSGDCIGIKDKGMSFIYDQAMRISTSTRLYLAMQRYRIEHPKKQFLVIQPPPSESALFAHPAVSFDSKVELLRYGYQSTALALRSDVALYRDSLKPYGIHVTTDRFQEP